MSEDQCVLEFYVDLVGVVLDEGDEVNVDLFVDVDYVLIGMKLIELCVIGCVQQWMCDGSYGECIDCDGVVGYEWLLVWLIVECCMYC